jgi:hypothetical protein
MEPEDGESLAAGGWFINHERERAMLPVHRVREMPQVPTRIRDVESP